PAVEALGRRPSFPAWLLLCAKNSSTPRATRGRPLSPGRPRAGGDAANDLAEAERAAGGRQKRESSAEPAHQPERVGERGLDGMLNPPTLDAVDGRGNPHRAELRSLLEHEAARRGRQPGAEPPVERPIESR